MLNEKVISSSGRAEVQVDLGLRAHMIRVYNNMFVGLLLTALVAYRLGCPNIIWEVMGLNPG